MRTGVMLRAIDEKQGIGIYTQNLMDRLLALDRDNTYALFYRNPRFLGRYVAMVGTGSPAHVAYYHVAILLLLRVARASDVVKLWAAFRSYNSGSP